jgi:ABC-type nitrate/sulfonate/bicarbonate transport system substrate-binding protein
MKKTILAVVSLVIVCVGAYHIFQTPERTADPEPIRLGIAPYPGYGSFYIAQEKQFFAEQGIEVDIIPLSLDAMFPALESGAVDLLVGSADTMPIIADAGIAAKQIFFYKHIVWCGWCSHQREC